ncbi:DUF5590 domain-containing protein [Fructilactobacillus cliffordii]|uniref:cell wall elongation regulator TseB-like domain-containing protein n=1 Tax=Fructilactobacillus cliffordii TaxID=2940299 RepID=UPI0020925E3E|nr:DUF5590 domain-containing protein [Fructilactobacillus cliffordii]USS86670.1 DUF5590 domain-containing protein [Fructilactobacillus cliffordii]
MREERKRRILIRRWLSWIVGILLALVVAFVVVVYIAKLPQKHTLKTATQLAEQHAQIHDVQRTYKADVGKQPYYTVVGQNSSNKPAYAVVSGDWKHIQVMKQKDGITAEEASAIAQQHVKGDSEVTNAGLLINKKKPTWAVTIQKGNQIHYVLINFKSGKLIKKINL